MYFTVISSSIGGSWFVWISWGGMEEKKGSLEELLVCISHLQEDGKVLRCTICLCIHLGCENPGFLRGSRAKPMAPFFKASSLSWKRQKSREGARKEGSTRSSDNCHLSTPNHSRMAFSSQWSFKYTKQSLPTTICTGGTVTNIYLQPHRERCSGGGGNLKQRTLQMEKRWCNPPSPFDLCCQGPLHNSRHFNWKRTTVGIQLSSSHKASKGKQQKLHASLQINYTTENLDFCTTKLMCHPFVFGLTGSNTTKLIPSHASKEVVSSLQNFTQQKAVCF